MTPAPVAVGDVAVMRGGAIGRVKAVTQRRVLVSGVGWLARTADGAEFRRRLDDARVVVFRAPDACHEVAAG